MPKSDPPTNKKNVFSNFVYQTNYRFRKGFKSGSFVDSKNYTDKPIQNTSTQTNFCSSTTLNLSVTPRKIDIFRENCTQTSKTVIVQSPKDCGTDRLSMDSLSPRYDGRRHCAGDTLELAKQPKKNPDMPFQRKTDVIRYLNQCEESQKTQECHSHQPHGLLAGNALTKVYLEKNRSKIGTIATENISDTARNLVSDLQLNTKLKSQSYVLERSSVVIKSPRPLVRFRVKPSSHLQVHDKTKSMNYFLHPSMNIISPRGGDDSVGSRKNTSFMSPTISSESKDQSIEINSIQKLIAPTKKGRTPSPKTYNVSNHSKKVPYIDKSEATILMDRKVGDDEDIARISLKSSCNEISSDASTISTDSALTQAISKLRDPDWNTALRGLAEVVEIGRILDSDVIYPHMTIINQRLIELIKSPRSHVSRTSCQAIGHLFEYVKDTRRPEFDELVDSLLFKCADSNKFIRHDANLALDCMVTHIPTFHSIRAICTKGPDHKNPLVRIAAARLLVCAIVIAGVQNILHPQNNEFTRRRIILNMTKFMNDRDAEVRKYGERVYKMLCKDRIFDLYLSRYLERDVISKMKKLMRTENGRKF
nr:uncharacterized protein LOC111502573 isoform X1 [Leptinotarsa decemlineata]